MVKYIKLVIAMVGVTVAGLFFDHLPGVYWFLAKSTLSCLAVYLCHLIATRLSAIIGTIETIFVIITFLACYGYLYDQSLWYHENYVAILNTTIAAEIIILLGGGLKCGSRHIQRDRNNNTNRRTRPGLPPINRRETLL